MSLSSLWSSSFSASSSSSADLGMDGLSSDMLFPLNPDLMPVPSLFNTRSPMVSSSLPVPPSPARAPLAPLSAQRGGGIEAFPLDAYNPRTPSPPLPGVAIADEDEEEDTGIDVTGASFRVCVCFFLLGLIRCDRRRRRGHVPVGSAICRGRQGRSGCRYDLVGDVLYANTE